MVAEDRRSRFRAVVIGAGFIGSRYNELFGAENRYSHCAAFDASPHFDLTGILDSDPARSTEAASFWNTRGYADLDTLMEAERPEIVGVAIPATERTRVLRRLAQVPSVKGILLEKPVAADGGEAQQIKKIAEASGWTVCVNLIRRYCRGHRQVSDLLKQGALGRLQAVTGFYTKGLRHNGVHMLDLMNWYLGAPESFSAEVSDIPGQPGSDPGLNVRLRYRSGVSAVINACDADAHAVFELDMLGTDGRIRIEDLGDRIVRYHVGESPRYPGYRTLGSPEEIQSGMNDTTLAAAEDLAQAVRENRSPYCGLTEALAAEDLASQIIASV